MALRVCVFGAGSIGGHLAARFSHGGAEVSVIARGPHLDAIKKDGISVEVEGELLRSPVRATERPADLGSQDAVIVTVKAPSLPSVAASIAPLLGPDTTVVFVMNGIPWWYFYSAGGKYDGRRLPGIDPNNQIWDAISPERVIGGVAYAASEVIAPGRIRVTSKNQRIILGEPNGTSSDRSNAIAVALRRGGMKTDVSTVIRQEVWAKICTNLATGMMAVLTHSFAREVMKSPAAEAAARRVFTECLEIAGALGCRPLADVDNYIAAAKTNTHKPSILQDLEQGRQMEVEALWATPILLARLAHVETPALDLLVALATLRAKQAGLAPREVLA